jgi:hypothetical protein
LIGVRHFLQVSYSAHFQHAAARQARRDFYCSAHSPKISSADECPVFQSL